MKTIVTHAKIIRVGNSSALILPTIIFENYNFNQGDDVKIHMLEKGLVIVAPKPHQKRVNKK